MGGSGEMPRHVSIKDFPQWEGETSEEYRLRLSREGWKKQEELNRRKKWYQGTGYTQASEVRVTDRDGNVRIEESLTPEESAQLLAKDWQVILPGGGKGAEIIRADRKPRTWGMSPTKREREAAHRRRIEEMKGR